MAVSIYFFDVGQGDCTMIIDDQPPYFLAFVDAGSTKNADATFEGVTLLSINEIVKELLPPHVNIDIIILTHPDRDHVNLIVSLLNCEALKGRKIERCLFGGREKLYKKKVMVPTIMKRKGGAGTSKKTIFSLYKEVDIIGFIKQTGKCTNFNDIRIGSVERRPNAQQPDSRVGYEIVYRYDGVSKNLNHYSIVSCFYIYADAESQDIKGQVILAGDAEKEIEEKIISSRNPGGNNRVTALRLGHHGSKNATSESWLKYTQPTLAFVSSDFRYGHPSQDAVGRVIKHFNDQNAAIPMQEAIDSKGDSTSVDGIGQGHSLLYAEGRASQYILHSTLTPIFSNMIFHKYDRSDIAEIKKKSNFVKDSAETNSRHYPATISAPNKAIKAFEYFSDKVYQKTPVNCTVGTSWVLVYQNEEWYLQRSLSDDAGGGVDDVVVSVSFTMNQGKLKLIDKSLQPTSKKKRPNTRSHTGKQTIKKDEIPLDSDIEDDDNEDEDYSQSMTPLIESSKDLSGGRLGARIRSPREDNEYEQIEVIKKKIKTAQQT
ncbi:ComEC/Rec2 family competence protein [Azospirillum sp. sgz302134]